MDGMMGTLLDRLQGFFSKSFILAGFLPLAGALILNGLLLQWVFPETHSIVHSLLQPDKGSVLPNWALLVVLTYVLGMILASLNPGLRHLLEGRYLPPILQDWKRRQFYAELKNNQVKRSIIRKELIRLRKAQKPKSGWVEELKKARLAGNKLPIPGTPLNQGLQKDYAHLRAKQLRWETIRFEELKTLFSQLQSELQSRPVSKSPELDQMQVGFADLLDYARGKAEIEHSRVDAAIRQRFPRQVGSLQCTELANIMEVYREYSLDRFGLDSELFWLRMLKLARSDKEFYPLLDDAKTQLDFTVAVTVLLGLTVSIWLPLSLLFAPTIWPFLLVTVIGLPTVSSFYRIVIQAYLTFAEIVRAALDLYRFDLLIALHLPLPKDLAGEQDTWNKLASLAAGSHVELTYQHGEPEVHQKPAEIPKDSFWKRLKIFLGVK